MYKEYLHTLMYKYCSNVVLLLHCTLNIFKTLHRAVFFMSRRNAIFWSKVGKAGVGEQGISRWEASRWPSSQQAGSWESIVVTVATSKLCIILIRRVLKCDSTQDGYTSWPLLLTVAVHKLLYIYRYTSNTFCMVLHFHHLAITVACIDFYSM